MHPAVGSSGNFGTRALLRVVAACAVFVSASIFATPIAVPPLIAHVNDSTETLTPAQASALDIELAALEARKGAQVVVLIVPTLTASDGEVESIEAFATRAFDLWKLGREHVDDGVLLIVAKNDHQVRIEVGRGLEGAIPDAAAARIIREYIAPHFREGNYYGGLHDATTALTALIDGESLPAPLVDEPQPIPLPVFFVAVLIFSLVPAGFLNRALNALPLSMLSTGKRRAIGLAFGILCIYAIAAFLFGGPLLSDVETGSRWLGIATVAGLCGAMSALVAPLGASEFSLARPRRGGRRGRVVAEPVGPGRIALAVLAGLFSGGSSGSSSGSSGGSSSSGSSGGYSGGGGSSAGGGASGSW